MVAAVQSAGLPGSQEGPTGNVHTCTTAEIESVAADAGVGDQANSPDSANRDDRSPMTPETRKREAIPPVIFWGPLLAEKLRKNSELKLGIFPAQRNP